MANGVFYQPPAAIDLLGQFSRGQQVGGNIRAQRQQQAINPLVQAAMGGDQSALSQLSAMGPQGIKAIQDVQGLQKSQQDQQLVANEERLKSVVTGAAEVQGLPPEKQLPILMRRRQSLLASGITDTSDTDEVIGLIQSGQADQANQLIDQAVSLGQQRGILQPIASPELAAKELDLKQQTLDIRREEARQRALDRDIAKEDNAIRRETLQQKLQESRDKADQGRRELEFEANSAVAAVDDTAGTIDRMLEGEGLESAAGVSSMFPTVPGSRAANFEAQLETLQSQAFLSQVNKMAGMGALSENEGRKLGAALGSLSLSMGDKALRKELKRIRGELTKAKTNLEAKFNINKSSQSGASQVGKYQVEVVE